VERGDGGLDAPPGRARAGGSGKIPTCGLTGAVHPLHIRVELGAARRLLQGLCHRVYTRHDTFLSCLLELNCAIHPSEALSSRESRTDPTSPRTPSRNVCTPRVHVEWLARAPSFDLVSREVGPKVISFCFCFVSRAPARLAKTPLVDLRRAREEILAQAAWFVPLLLLSHCSILGPIHPTGSRLF